MTAGPADLDEVGVDRLSRLRFLRRLGAGMGDFSTAEAGGRLSATLFTICGLLVLAASPLQQERPGSHRGVVIAVGAAAVGAGLVIWRIPWHRWGRASTLWIFVPAMGLITLHNVATGNDGFRYDVFFFVVFAWVGLVHPRGTSLICSPTLIVAYLAPAAFTSVRLTTLAGGLAYVYPVAMVIGEAAAWVSDRVRGSEHELRVNEQRFRSLIQHSTDVISVVDGSGRIVFDSPSVEAILGYRPDERLGRPALNYVASDQAALLRRTLTTIEPEGVFSQEMCVLHADGGWRWCDVTIRDLLGDPAVAGIVVNMNDVTTRKMAAEALAEGEASFRSLFASNPHPMWVVARDGSRFIEVNEAAVRHYGYSRSDFLTMGTADLLVDPAQGAGAGRHASARHRLADGRVVDVETTTHDLTFRNQPAALVAIQDVTDRKALDAQLRHQAFHDSLTNLANRALFADRVDHALARRGDASRCALLLIDLDGFKTINDSLGHVTGDHLLVLVAERLEQAVRPADTVARLGGDEFAVLVEELYTPDAATVAAERVLEALRRPFTIGTNELTIGASIGIAVAGADSSPEALLRDADVAMYRAKAEGKGTHRLFQPAMRGAALSRLELERDLRHAVEQEQFVLHFQPMTSLHTGRIVGCEALVRWNHPTRGQLAPDKFINVAEESGLIVALGRWVLAQACRQATRLGAIGVSVNLSARQLADPALPDEVRGVLRETGLDPARLTLEITESVLMRDTLVAIHSLNQLRDLGVRLSIDDFGTGYSSLGYLRTFRVDELKIDKGFIDALPDDTQGAALVAGILGLAATLGLSTVAEGIETAEQLHSVALLGCDTAQGYAIGRPMPGEDLVVRLAEDEPPPSLCGQPGSANGTAGATRKAGISR